MIDDRDDELDEEFEPDPDDEPLDWDSHPSLSAADRNPSLR